MTANKRKTPRTCAHPHCPCHPPGEAVAAGGPCAWPMDVDRLPDNPKGWRDVGHDKHAHWFTGVAAYPLCGRGFYWHDTPPAAPDAVRCPGCLEEHARTSAFRVAHGLDPLPA